MTACDALRGCRILIVEDEFLLADELANEMTYVGVVVMGPVPSIEAALAVLEPGPAPDAVVLDVNLAGEVVFPLADTLAERGIPFVFVTGDDPSTLPRRFAGVPTCEKPLTLSRLAAALSRAMHAHSGSRATA